jgi:hypothetical protein
MPDCRRARPLSLYCRDLPDHVKELSEAGCPPSHCERREHIMPSRRSLHGVSAIAVVSLSLIALIATPGHGAQVLLTWNAPTNGGSPSPTDLVGYRLYYGLSSGNYHVILDVGNALSAALDGLEGGQTYYFAVTVYDINGFESDLSNEVSTTITSPSQKPK